MQSSCLAKTGWSGGISVIVISCREGCRGHPGVHTGHCGQAAPVRWGQEAGLTGADQAERWLDGIRASGLRVRALLGFCGGGVYAAVMADVIARWQDRPHLVLFDPGFAKRQMLVEHLESFFRR